MSTEATLLDRIRALEARIDYLERGQAVGITGTDQTIKGCHDRIDAMIGADIATPPTTPTANRVLAMNASAKWPAMTVSGALTLDSTLGVTGAATLSSTISVAGQETFMTYTKRAVFSKTGISDNVQTNIFTVTTTNESGSNDGGGFICFCNCLVGHAIASNATGLAIVADHCVMQRINKADGTATSAMGEIWEGGVSASASATRSIASVTPGQTATSNYVTTMWLTIDLTGTSVTTAQAVVAVELIWWGYLTAPTLAAA